MSPERQLTVKPAPVAPVSRPGFGVLQRKCACGGSGGAEGQCQECKQKEMSLQRRASGGSAAPAAVPPIVHEVLRSPGRPLDPATRAFMEPRFGHDFSKVRVHADERAAESARAVNALAYMVGSNIVFGAGQYTPGASGGRKLLAHELAHVVQQAAAGTSGIPEKIRIGSADDSAEREAERFGRLDWSQIRVVEERPRLRRQRQQDVSGSTQTSGAESEKGGGEANSKPLVEGSPVADLQSRLEGLRDRVRRLRRDQGLPSNIESGGETHCNPETGVPEFTVDEALVPKCMLPCARKHEETHVDFIRAHCEDVHEWLARAQFWIDKAKEANKNKDAAGEKRALDEATKAEEEAEKAVKRYEDFFNKTCLTNEGLAYEEGILLCDTDAVKKECQKTGETDKYRRQMAAWRVFMQNPPNCPKPAPRRP